MKQTLQSRTLGSYVLYLNLLPVRKVAMVIVLILNQFETTNFEITATIINDKRSSKPAFRIFTNCLVIRLMKLVLHSSCSM